MLDFIDVAFLTDRVIPSLNMGLEVSLKLIIPAALIGGALGVFTGVVRVFGPRWARRLGDKLRREIIVKVRFFQNCSICRYVRLLCFAAVLTLTGVRRSVIIL